MSPLSTNDFGHDAVIIGSLRFTNGGNSSTSKDEAATKKPLHFETSSLTATLSKKKVSFNETVRAKKCPHIANYSVAEVEACWYNKEEKDAMRLDAKFVGDMIKTGMLPEDFGNYCRRGLESYEVASIKQAKQIREGTRLILENQFEISTGDIALVYEDLAANARSQARARGLKDEMDVFY